MSESPCAELDSGFIRDGVRLLFAGNAHWLPFGDRVFPIVFSSYALEHCSGPWGFLRAASVTTAGSGRNAMSSPGAGRENPGA